MIADALAGKIDLTPTVKEKAIEKCFVDAFNKVLSRKEEITDNYALCLDAITDVTELNARKAELGERIQEESKRTSDFLYRMSGRNDDLDGVNEKYNAFVAGIYQGAQESWHRRFLREGEYPFH